MSKSPYTPPDGQIGIFPTLPRPMNTLMLSSISGYVGRSTFNSWTAMSMMRKLLMQIAVLDRFQDLIKFGMAMAASNPTVETTIIISTKVKPRDRGVPFRSSVFTHRDAISSQKTVQPGNRLIYRRESTGRCVGPNTSPKRKKAREFNRGPVY